eukprot:gene2763-3391_t
MSRIPACAELLCAELLTVRSLSMPGADAAKEKSPLTDVLAGGFTEFIGSMFLSATVGCTASNPILGALAP